MRDVASMKKSTTPPVGTKVGAAPLTEPCEHHPHEVIKMYCGKHEVVCCRMYIALDHRECEGADYIPKVAEGVRTSEEFQEFVDNLAELKDQYQEKKEQIEEEIQKITNVKDEIIKDIKHFKREIIAKVDELETRSIERVNERCKQLKERMNMTVSKVEKLLEQIRDDLRELDNESEASLFVRLKSARWQKMKNDDIDRDINGFEGLNLSLDIGIQDALDQSDGLVKADAPRKIAVKSKHDVTFDSDTGTCGISDICLLNDGTIVMSDFKNKSLKRFSKTFGKMEKINSKGTPFGICTIFTNDEFVVTLNNICEAQFVKYTEKKMILKKSFPIGAKCRGICLRHGNLFISCGGEPQSNVPGHIRKFDVSGNMLCTIETDNSGNRLFAHPRLLTLNFDGTKIYVADRINGVTVLDKAGKKLGQYKHVNLKGPFSVSCSRYGNFVSGYDSKNIHLFDDNNRFVGTVLNSGLKKPGALCFVKSNKQMILSLGNSNEILLIHI